MNKLIYKYINHLTILSLFKMINYSLLLIIPLLLRIVIIIIIIVLMIISSSSNLLRWSSLVINLEIVLYLAALYILTSY